MARFGIFIELATPESVEMAGWAGWDHCVIDCEHAPIDNAGLPGMLRAARIPAYVRVPNSNPESIQGALDNGANGVIVPRLQSAEEARRVVEGTTTGQHKSPLKGSSVEFRQHRFYTPGDEPRRLDWRVLSFNFAIAMAFNPPFTSIAALGVNAAAAAVALPAATSPAASTVAAIAPVETAAEAEC